MIDPAGTGCTQSLPVTGPCTDGLWRLAWRRRSVATLAKSRFSRCETASSQRAPALQVKLPTRLQPLRLPLVGEFAAQVCPSRTFSQLHNAGQYNPDTGIFLMVPCRISSSALWILFSVS